MSLNRPLFYCIVKGHIPNSGDENGVKQGNYKGILDICIDDVCTAKNQMADCLWE